MSRDLGAYFTLVTLVSLLFFLTTQDHRLTGSASVVLHTTEARRIFTGKEYFTDLEQRLSRFRQKTGYAIKLVELYGVAPQNMRVVATERFEQHQKDHPGSKGIVVVVFGTAGGGAAIKTSESLRARFPKDVEANISTILQRSPQTYVAEQIVHVILEHLDLWFYVLEPSKVSMFLVRYPTAEMILLVFAPVLGLLTGISSTAFTPVRYLRQWSRFWACGIVGICVAIVFAFIVRQPGGIYPGMFGYALGMGFIVSGMVGLLKKFWLYETFKGRQPGGWWNGPVHFHYG